MNANGNFIDVAVLEWCKLFSDTNGKHHWSKVVHNDPQFLNATLTAIGKTQQEWNDYVKSMKNYRDKFIAHWDDLEHITVPELDIAKDSAVYLLDHLVEKEGEGPEQWEGVPHPADDFYEERLAEGRADCGAKF